MKNNLTARTVVIVVTLLICVFGIIGFPKSGADVAKNFSDKHPAGSRSEGRHPPGSAKSGAQDAVKADADQTAERVKGRSQESRTSPGTAWTL